MPGSPSTGGVPGFTTADLAELIDPPGFPTSPGESLDRVSCPQVADQLREDVAWAVVFCGANDVNRRYDEYYEGAIDGGALDDTRDNLYATVEFILAKNPAVKIVLVNVPDVGFTPRARDDYPDPAKRATATIASLSDRLAALAAAKGVALADCFSLTRQLDGAGPFNLNGTALLKQGHPENPPRYLIAKDGFHPSTAAQALIANIIIRAMNRFYGAHFAPVPNREILSDVLDLIPDQPFLDWLSARGLSGGAHGDDPDRDGIPLLAEFFSGIEPGIPDASIWSVIAAAGPGGGLRCSLPSDHSGGYASATSVWNADLACRAKGVDLDGFHRHVAIPASVGPRAFLQIEFGAAP